MFCSHYCFSQAFIGNIDRDRYSVNTLVDSPLSKKFRIHLLTWHQAPAMRMELYGCGDSGNYTVLAFSFAVIRFVFNVLYT